MDLRNSQTSVELKGKMCDGNRYNLFCYYMKQNTPDARWYERSRQVHPIQLLPFMDRPIHGLRYCATSVSQSAGQSITHVTGFYLRPSTSQDCLHRTLVAGHCSQQHLRCTPSPANTHSDFATTLNSQQVLPPAGQSANHQHNKK